MSALGHSRTPGEGPASSVRWLENALCEVKEPLFPQRSSAPKVGRADLPLIAQSTL
jgi:hypothetical protein